MITCLIRYVLDLNKKEEFINYALIWMKLIEKYSGTHHGYFLPFENEHKSFSLSFPSIGTSGPDNIAVALFSFSCIEKYNEYLMSVKNDKECQSITEKTNQDPCFISYERSFLYPLMKNVNR